MALIAVTFASTPPEARFIRFDEAAEALTAFGRTEDAASWDLWIRNQDRDVRARVERGVEDSISNLILYGTSFTQLPGVESPESAVNSDGELIDAARARVHAAAIVLAHPVENERLRFARDFLLKHDVAAANLEQVLADSLKRFGLEQRGYQEKLRAAHQESDPSAELFVRATLFEQRGLSVDTSLLPNFALEDTLRALMRKGVIREGGVRSIAVIGPGLDFADKREGYDLYPLQTIQPFAMLEAVLRLGLGKAGEVQITTLDLNPAVNAHLKQTVDRARAGKPYRLQLPRDPTSDWKPEAVAYWAHFGEVIGSPIAPAAEAPRGLTVHAVAIQPRYAALIDPRDVNVVRQMLPGKTFDLVIATNILVYYERFEQAVAMKSVAMMMNPGGVFLSNTVLPAQRPAELAYLGRRSVSYSVSGAFGDDVVVYQRK